MKQNSLMVGTLAAVVFAITGCVHTDAQLAARSAEADTANILTLKDPADQSRLADRVASLQKKIPSLPSRHCSSGGSWSAHGRIHGARATRRCHSINRKAR